MPIVYTNRRDETKAGGWNSGFFEPKGGFRSASPTLQIYFDVKRQGCRFYVGVSRFLGARQLVAFPPVAREHLVSLVRVGELFRLGVPFQDLAHLAQVANDVGEIA